MASSAPKDIARSPSSTVAVIGGGASGALVAAQLLRRSHRRGLRVVVIEPRSRVGLGLAYSTTDETHRLNVPAGQMGALPRDPGHFVRWAAGCGHEIEGADFPPRALYGEYLVRVLDDAERSSLPGITLERVRDEAVGIRILSSAEPPLAVVELASGSTVSAAHVVLALGNLPPSDPDVADRELIESDRYEPDPWDPQLAERARGDEKVLLLGTGLTMVDVALTLNKQPTPASILTVSRQGLLPQKHRRNLAPPNRWFELPPSEVNLSELISRIESEVAGAQANGDDWRQVVDALRPYTNRIWRRLGDEDREEFVRHLSRRWDAHRHRMAPEIGRTLEVLRASGRLRLARGRVEGLRLLSGDEIEVTLEPAEGESASFRVGRLVNCTGPSLDLAGGREPVLGGLFRDGYVRPGPLGLGLDHDSRGALLDSHGTPSAMLSTIGPLRKGRLWETTAMPEIRTQAFELADKLTAQLEQLAAKSKAAA
ncbi:MAG: FAD/NAD(P)-binding protein [Actinomycetota bacterium]|nr:FAD/NAD(P)-binding protein [Actinomycetota bacterium]